MKFAVKAAIVIAATGITFATPIISWAGNSEPLKVSGADAARGITQVAIGAFNVGFIFQSVDETKASGGLMGAFGGATKTKSTLVGVTPEMMQKVTDDAYADFVAQLAAKGFTLQDPAALFAHATMTNPHAQASPVEINVTLEKGSKGKVTYFKPAALPALILIPGDFTGSGMSSIGINMSAGQAAYALSSYAKASSVPVIDVTYMIDFSNTQRPGAFSFGGLKVNSGLSVSAGYSRLSLLSASGKNSVLAITQPVAVAGEFIEQQETTSGVGKTTQAAANVAGGVAAAFGMGGMRFGKTREYEFTAKPGNYEEGATKAASLASGLLTDRLAGLR
ncbi:MAG: hypothetical protein ABIM50_09665 [Novosphingobium sp.]